MRVLGSALFRVVLRLFNWFLLKYFFTNSVQCSIDEIIRSKTKETGARFLITDLQRAGRFEQAVRGLIEVEVIVIGGRVDYCTSFDDLLLEESVIEDGHVGGDGSLTAWLGFSSGTTGGPKGIIHSQATMRLFAKTRW